MGFRVPIFCNTNKFANTNEYRDSPYMRNVYNHNKNSPNKLSHLSIYIIYDLIATIY